MTALPLVRHTQKEADGASSSVSSSCPSASRIFAYSTATGEARLCSEYRHFARDLEGKTGTITCDGDPEPPHVIGDVKSGLRHF